MNSGLSVSKRVKDLVQKMTLEEKVGQMTQYQAPGFIKARAFGDGEAVKRLISAGLIGSLMHAQSAQEANELQEMAERTRLGIPILIVTDAMHGAGYHSGTTIFPTPISLASTWDDKLVYEVASITARELRSIGIHWNLSPVLDVGRDPRWGRIAETFGEDPFLVTQMGVAMVRGYQGEDASGPENVVAGIKHFIAYSQPLRGLNTGPVDISERTLRTVFLPPFAAAVQVGTLTVMPGYHSLNGIPCHSSRELLTKLLREEMGFRGFVITDNGAVERLVTHHRIAESRNDAVEQAVLAGIDMHMCGPGFSEPLIELVKQGRISERRIDESVFRILEIKFRMGLFEKRTVDPAKAGKILCCSQHREKALEAARKSIVLLKNEGGLLPLTRRIKSIFITGPNADNNAFLGDWTVPQPKENVISILSGLRDKAQVYGAKIDYMESGGIWDITQKRIQEAVSAAADADVAIVVVGGNQNRYDETGKLSKRREERTGGEGIDCSDLALCGRQLDLVKAIHESGTAAVVVLIGGRPLAVEWIAENIPVVIQAWEPGMCGGQAVAEILYGEVNPSGKLPVSIPRSAGHLPCWYNFEPSLAYTEGYKFTDQRPLYQFGFGLSYTEFEYSGLTVSDTVHAGERVKVSVEIQNTGKIAGEEVIQLYINNVVSSVATPVRILKGFQRVSLEPGKRKTVVFELEYDELALYNKDMEKVVEPGVFEVMVGNQKAAFRMV